MADPRPTVHPVHPAHDTILVAALAAGDLADVAKADALALVAACPDCAALHADLLAIAAATKALPAPVRTRDFRLTPEQAARLRPSGPRRWLAALGSPRFALSRPLAVAFTTLGLAGLLLTALPAGGPMAMFSGAAERQAATSTDTNAGDAGAPAAPAAPASTPEPAIGGGSIVPGPAASAGPGTGSASGAGGGATDVGSEGSKDDGASSVDRGLEEGGPPWTAILSVVLLAVGVSLFVLRAAARRVSQD